MREEIRTTRNLVLPIVILRDWGYPILGYENEDTWRRRRSVPDSYLQVSDGKLGDEPASEWRSLDIETNGERKLDFRSEVNGEMGEEAWR